MKKHEREKFARLIRTRLQWVNAELAMAEMGVKICGTKNGQKFCESEISYWKSVRKLVKAQERKINA